MNGVSNICPIEVEWMKRGSILCPNVKIRPLQLTFNQQNFLSRINKYRSILNYYFKLIFQMIQCFGIKEAN